MHLTIIQNHWLNYQYYLRGSFKHYLKEGGGHKTVINNIMKNQLDSIVLDYQGHAESITPDEIKGGYELAMLHTQTYYS